MSGFIELRNKARSSKVARSIKFTVTFNEEEHKRLCEVAQKQNISLAAAARESIFYYHYCMAAEELPIPKVVRRGRWTEEVLSGTPSK